MGTIGARQYEDKDYLRYYALYGGLVSAEAVEEDEWEDPEELLAQDEISVDEEGFWRGYRRS